MKNPGKIKNKAKRTEVYAKYKKQKKKIKKDIKTEKSKEAEALGNIPVVKRVITLSYCCAL